MTFLKRISARSKPQTPVSVAPTDDLVQTPGICIRVRRRTPFSFPAYKAFVLSFPVSRFLAFALSFPIFRFLVFPLQVSHFRFSFVLVLVISFSFLMDQFLLVFMSCPLHDFHISLLISGVKRGMLYTGFAMMFWKFAMSF